MEVEIDPELFIKCRLCIEDNGSYQITPTLLEHIKFVFDIKIEPFDGLSQVLCKTCKERLEYFECLKRNVQENQNVIKLKRRDSTKNTFLKKPRKSVESSEDVKLTQTPVADQPAKQDEIELHRVPVEPGDTEKIDCRSWEENFQIYFVCRYCDKHCKTKQILVNHINSHVDFRRFCRNTLKKHCKVALNRINALPNITGASNKIVVYDSSTLVQDKNNIDYYVTYLPIGKIPSNKNLTECTSKKNKRKKWRISSDDDSDVKQPPLRKKIRLISDSSSSDSENEDSAILNISDDDDDDQDDARSDVRSPNCQIVTDSVKELNKSETPVESPHFFYTEDVKDIVDLNSIRSNIELSYKRFMRPFNSFSSNTDRENMLRRKVLSIGRKVMSKCGIPSNGLLNYCEYNDLPLSVKFHNRLISDESQYVRVLTKIKDFEKDNSLIGFEKVPKVLLNGNETLKEQSVNGIKTYNNVNKPVNSDIATVEAVSSKLPEKEQMVQLLNKTPVANPKKIHKKKMTMVTNTPNNFISLIDSDEDEPNLMLPIITATTSLASKDNEHNNNKEDNSDKEDKNNKKDKEDINDNRDKEDKNDNKDKDDTNYNGNKEDNKDKEDNNDKEGKNDNNDKEDKNEKVTSSTLTDANTNNSLPRIKCKPVTQLMSNTALYNLTEQVNKAPKPLNTNNTILANQLNTSHARFKNIARSLPPWKPQSTVNNAPSAPAPALIPNAAMVVLETDEQNSPLPITKTRFPLSCLKTLLCNHSLSLIDSKTEHTEHFSTLTKYVLDMRCNNNSQQISVTFKVLNNKFCLKSDFSNGAPIDIEQLTPTWQWEILKSLCNYQSSCTVMRHAEMLGNEIYKNCILFYKVLFSIEKFDCQVA